MQLLLNLGRLPRGLAGISFLALVFAGTSCSIFGERDFSEALTKDYRVTVQLTWSATTHPGNFPENGRVTGLVGASHVSEFSLWMPGEMASDAVRILAIHGQTSPLEDLINGARDREAIRDSLYDLPTIRAPGQFQSVVGVHVDHPALSVVGRIAPSPDWITGVSSIRLYNEEQGWVPDTTITLYPYDAGIIDGSSFFSAGGATDPREPIRRIHSEPFLVNGELRAIGEVHLERLPE